MGSFSSHRSGSRPSPQQGRKVFTLQTLPDERDADDTPAVGNVAGFSLHAGVAAKANQRDKVRSRSDREGALGYKLVRVCRYITRPAIAEKRLSLTKQGKGNWKVAADQDEKTPAQRHVAMSWAQRLKRAFNIDVETCRACGGSAKVISCIEDPVIIRKILNHLQEKSPRDSAIRIPHPRAPPQASLFG